jgi:hypothetical protein
LHGIWSYDHSRSAPDRSSGATQGSNPPVCTESPKRHCRSTAGAVPDRWPGVTPRQHPHLLDGSAMMRSVDQAKPALPC